MPPRADILIVEDDEEQLSALRDLIENAGYVPHLARSAKEASRLGRSISPSLVLLDVGLPDTSGFELTKKLKREAPSFLPVVLLTGQGDMEYKRQGVEAGADEFLQKPVSAFDLVLRLQSLLRIKALTDELSAKNQRLQELAHTDALCGIPNRRYVLDQLRRETRRAGRYGGALAVLLFDLDHFKDFNDRYGHATGDAVLRSAATALAAGIRHEDTVGRFGGEEFLVVAPHIGLQEVLLMADRLRERIAAEEVSAGDEQLRLTTSVGVAAAAPGFPRAPTDLLAEADRALYMAKAEGRNCVAVAPQQDHDGGLSLKSSESDPS